MAADPRITNAVASAACDAIVDLIDAGAGAGNRRLDHRWLELRLDENTRRPGFVNAGT